LGGEGIARKGNAQWPFQYRKRNFIGGGMQKRLQVRLRKNLQKVPGEVITVQLKKKLQKETEKNPITGKIKKK